MLQIGNPSVQSLIIDKAGSKIDEDIITAYLETHYRVSAAPPFVMRVGEVCPELVALYKKMRVSCCAYITACNPHSQQEETSTNAELQAALAHQLQGRGLSYISGVGQHPSTQWPGEPSMLVPGPAQEAAKKLGQRFRQNAILWCGPDALARLILLR